MLFENALYYPTIDIKDEACNKDADERKLPMGAKVVY